MLKFLSHLFSCLVIGCLYVSACPRVMFYLGGPKHEPQDGGIMFSFGGAKGVATSACQTAGGCQV